MRKICPISCGINSLNAAADHVRNGGGAADARSAVGAVLVVTGDDRLVGVFTGRDAVSRVLPEGKSLGKITLADVMTPKGWRRGAPPSKRCA